MANSVIPSDREIKGIDLNQNELVNLVRQAEEADAEDRKLTIRQALKHYKTATFWAMILSTSLIMEGFDLVTVSASYMLFLASMLMCDRSTRFTVKLNSKTSSALTCLDNQARKPSHQVGNQVFRTRQWSDNSLAFVSTCGHKIASDVVLR
jgi:hypothetical protein